MIQPNHGRYDIPEDLMDSILISQKEQLLQMINELPVREPKTQDMAMLKACKVSQIVGAIKVLSNLWSFFGYSYKTEELIKRLKEKGVNI